MERVAVVADLVVALDGAWRGFPHGRSRSPMEQREELKAACADFGLQLVREYRHWPSEVAKRARELELAANLGEGHWLLRLDADELLHCPQPALFRRGLEELDERYDAVELDIFGEQPNPHRFPSRRLLRVRPGLTCVDEHYIVCYPATPVTRYIVGHPDHHAMTPAWRFSRHVGEIEHKPDRTPARSAARHAYYRHREQQGLEQVSR